MAIKRQTLQGIVVDEQLELTTRDLCRACSVHAEWLVELVAEGILEPTGTDAAHWRFTGVGLNRALRVRRLQRDLGLNLAGAALALELLDEVAALRARLAAMHRSD